MIKKLQNFLQNRRQVVIVAIIGLLLLLVIVDIILFNTNQSPEDGNGPGSSSDINTLNTTSHSNLPYRVSDYNVLSAVPYENDAFSVVMLPPEDNTSVTLFVDLFRSDSREQFYRWLKYYDYPQNVIFIFAETVYEKNVPKQVVAEGQIPPDNGDYGQLADFSEQNSIEQGAMPDPGTDY